MIIFNYNVINVGILSYHVFCPNIRSFLIFIENSAHKISIVIFRGIYYYFADLQNNFYIFKYTFNDFICINDYNKINI